MSNSKCTNYNGWDAGQGTHKVHINPYYPKLFKTFPIKKRQARKGVEQFCSWLCRKMYFNAASNFQFLGIINKTALPSDRLYLLT